MGTGINMARVHFSARIMPELKKMVIEHAKKDQRSHGFIIEKALIEYFKK